MVWVERDLKDPLCNKQGHLSLSQVAASPPQPGLEHFQGLGSHSFSKQPAAVPQHPHCKECLPHI